MPYINPTSEVLLLQGVPLDNSYQHTIYWASSNQQAQWMMSHTIPNAAFSRLSYVRDTTGIVRVQQIADALKQCNYMMYKNSAYGNKWFYAFVTDIIYINDNTTEIRFEVDHVQTWYFETNFRPCLVERCHTSTDVPGQHIAAEPIELGPYSCISSVVIDDLSDLTIVIAYASGQGSDGGGGDTE